MHSSQLRLPPRFPDCEAADLRLEAASGLESVLAQGGAVPAVVLLPLTLTGLHSAVSVVTLVMMILTSCS